MISAGKALDNCTFAASFQGHIPTNRPRLAALSFHGAARLACKTIRMRREDLAFAGSCVYPAGMLVSIAFSLYPSVLPTSLNPFYGGLTISNAKASERRSGSLLDVRRPVLFRLSSNLMVCEHPEE